MRISVRIVSSQKKWLPRFPRIDLERCFPKSDDGSAQFDEADFKRQCAPFDYVMIGSNDGGTPLAFAAVLIASVNDWMDDTKESAGDTDEKRRKVKSRLDRNMSKGRYSFVRIDIGCTVTPWNGKLIRAVRVNITTDDNDVFEQCRFERDFAMIVADFCKCYSDRYVRRGDPPLVLTESTRQLLDELHERTVEAEINESNKRRLVCDRYCGGLCAPCKFDCPHYRDGRCVEIKG